MKNWTKQDRAILKPPGPLVSTNFQSIAVFNLAFPWFMEASWQRWEAYNIGHRREKTGLSNEFKYPDANNKRFRLVCASAQSDQRLIYSHIGIKSKLATW